MKTIVLLSLLWFWITRIVANNNNNNNNDSCNLFLAKSTIPQAGLGVFTGKPLQKGDHAGHGDVCIPLKDMEWQYLGTNEFVDPFGDYTWKGEPLGLKQEVGLFLTVAGFWPGLNAAVNCHPAILNVERSTPRYENFDDRLHRSKDPSVGSFSPYHNGSSIVTHYIPAGGEFFTSYGDDWFIHRLHVFPPNFPVPTSYRSAENFIKRFHRQIASRTHQKLVYTLIQDLRDNVWKESRFLQALPNDLESVDLALQEGIRGLFQKNTTRSLEYLQENGTCLDNIIAGVSTIQSAGRGAFAQRFLAKDTVITTSPLIHILDPSILDIHRFDLNDIEDRSFLRYGKIGSQLVQNYCLGHYDTTILLCPYSSGINYINHNQTLANVKLAWPKDGTLNHNASWLDVPLSQWKLQDKKSRLALEYIATRDIQPGEELFLDYGDDWENAYAEHVNGWNPLPDWDDYIPATIWNLRHKRQDVLRTEEEAKTLPYPKNLELRCHERLLAAWGYKGANLNWDEDPDKYNPEYGRACRVIRRRDEDPDDITYDVIITIIDEDAIDNSQDRTVKRKKVPRTALKWFDKAESTDMHLEGAFRHTIGIPDDILPDAWRKAPKKEIPKDSSNSLPTCDLYMAESTIPNSGIGMFSTKPIQAEELVGNGDKCIMLLDIHNHNQDEDDDGYPDMTEDYVWDARSFGLGHEVHGETGSIRAFWPGVNAASNYNSYLVNVDTTFPDYDDAGVHRSQSPGAGAFSPYHLGLPKAIRYIPAGGELFKYYGPNWFSARGLPEIPEEPDVDRAQILFDKLFSLSFVNESLYEVVLSLRKVWSSRSLNALPDKYADAKRAVNGDITDHHQLNATRDISWLEENGRCVDHIVPRKSNLEHAGHGAFAKRFLPKGTVISGSPLVHVVEETLEMYDLDFPDGSTKEQTGYQMLLNYCFGHDESTLLLCPYASGVNYINHNKSLANVKIEWAPNGAMGHNSTWLSLAPKDIEWIYKPNLAIDYIAIQDIHEGQELFIDYGDSWEKAWETYVNKWKPKKEWMSYLSAATMNKLLEKNLLRTQEEQESRPYPANLALKCDLQAEIYDDYFPNKEYHLCTILNRYADSDGESGYDVRIQLDDEGLRFADRYLHRSGIKFFDLPYSNDLHLRPAFRHQIGLPNDMVPSRWKNAASEEEFSSKRNDQNDEL